MRVKAFPMYGGIGVSAPSLHRESTDSLICECVDGYIFWGEKEDMRTMHIRDSVPVYTTEGNNGVW